MGLTIGLSGPVDTDAVSLAFDTLLQAHPVLAGHLELGSDGRHQIVADDFMPPGIWVTDGDDGPSAGSADDATRPERRTGEFAAEGR